MLRLGPDRAAASITETECSSSVLRRARLVWGAVAFLSFDIFVAATAATIATFAGRAVFAVATAICATFILHF